MAKIEEIYIGVPYRDVTLTDTSGALSSSNILAYLYNPQSGYKVKANASDDDPIEVGTDDDGNTTFRLSFDTSEMPIGLYALEVFYKDSDDNVQGLLYINKEFGRAIICSVTNEEDEA